MLAGIGAMLYGISYLAFTNSVTTHKDLVRVCYGLGGLGFLLIFVAVVMSLGISKKKFGVFPVILVLIGLAVLSGSQFALVNPSLWTETGFSVVYYPQAGAFIAFGIAGLIKLKTRSS